MALVLGIESSCDEAAVALVSDGHCVRAEAIASLADDFAAWGGVVPEIAARGHISALPNLIQQVLDTAGVTVENLDAVAVAAWPGLVGSLISGVMAAKMIAIRQKIPLIAVDHIQAHLAAVHLGREHIQYPFMGLVASGGHSHYYFAESPGRLTLVGGTIDDAAGEAFDKAAAVLGLGYPGGPLIDEWAQRGDSSAMPPLPRSFMSDDTIRLSFSGLKTAFLYRLKGPQGTDAVTLDDRERANACASFQTAIVDCLATKLMLAARQHGARAWAVGGGVACNRALRTRLQRDAQRLGVTLYVPEPRHCTDNAAMIAALGYFQWQRGDVAGYDLVPRPTGTAGPRVAQRPLGGNVSSLS